MIMFNNNQMNSIDSYRSQLSPHSACEKAGGVWVEGADQFSSFPTLTLLTPCN